MNISGPDDNGSNAEIVEAFARFIEAERPRFDDQQQEEVQIPLPSQFQIKNPDIIQEICALYLQAKWTIAEFTNRNTTFHLSRRKISPQRQAILPNPPTSATEISQNFDEFKVQFVLYVDAQRQQRDNGYQKSVSIPLPIELRVFDSDQQDALRQMFYQRCWQRVEFDEGATVLKLYRQSLRP